MAEMSRVAEAVLVDRPQEGTPKGARFSRQTSSSSRTLGRIRRQSKLVASLHSYQNEVMEKAAIVLQRALRVRWQVYRLFGPELFFDAYGQSGQSGAIAFAGCANPSFWIRVSHNSAPSRLVEFLVHFWQITRPEIIISITGGAQDFTMHHQLRGAFERGLAKASISAKSMIFTAGSDTGVMKLVGAAKQRHGIEAPLIGIFPWGATNGREQLMRNCGTIAWYKPTPPSKEGAPLNPHHTHFVFVDDGTENSASWGSEIQMRSKIESTLSTVKSVPVVVLVVQGGPGTLATVLSAARSAKPITILADSGGAATALFTFVTQGADALEERFVPYSDTMREIHELNELYEGRQLKFFRLEDGVADVTGTGQRDICETLLEGIIDMIGTLPASQLLPVGARVADATRGEGKVVKRESNGARWVQWDSTGETVRYEAQGMEAFTFSVPTGSWHQQSEEVGSPLLAKALNLCVAWDMPQMVGRVLASSYRVRNVSPVQGVGSLPEVGQALQRALELQHSGVAQLLWDLPGTSFKAVNMCKLYLKTAPHRSLESKQLQMNLRIAANLEIKQKLSYTARHKVFVESLQSTFHAVNNVLEYSLHMFSETRAHDIFLWLMFQGNCSFAKKVWSHCDRPVHIALLGTAICRKLESQSELVYNDVSLGDTVENWAYGAMEMSPSEARSRQVLELSLLENKPSNALDIAYAVAAKHFLTQRSVAAYIDLGWRGGFEDPVRAPNGTKETVITLPAKFSWISIAIQTMCPFLCPQVYLKSPEEEKTEYHDMTLLRALSLKAHLTKTEARNSRPSVSPVPSSPRARPRVQGWRYADVRFGDASHSAWNTEITTSLLKDARRILVPSEILKTGTADFRKRWFVVQEGESQRFHIYDMFMWLHEVMQPFAAFYKIPAVRLVNRAMVHVIGICLHCAMVLSFSSFHELDGLKSSSPRLPVMRFHWNNGDPIEFIWWCFELCIGLDSTHHRLIKVHHLRINNYEQNFERVSFVLLAVALISRVGMEISHEENYEFARSLYDVYIVALSLKSICVFVVGLKYLTVYKPIGVLIIMISQMVVDTEIFIILFTNITIAFSITLAGMQKVDRYKIVLPLEETDEVQSDTFSSLGGLWAPWWAVYGYYDPRRYDWLTSLLVWVYTLIGSVVLVNLLVAMFADTFARVKESSQQEYIFVKCGRLLMYRSVIHPVPPVINAPIILYKWLRFLAKLISILWSLFRGYIKNCRSSLVKSSRVAIVRGQRCSSRKKRRLSEAVLSDLRHSIEEAQAEPLNATSKLRPAEEDSEVADGRDLVDKFLQKLEFDESESLKALSHATREQISEMASRHIKSFELLDERVNTFEHDVATQHHALSERLDKVLAVLEDVRQRQGDGSSHTNDALQT